MVDFLRQPGYFYNVRGDDSARESFIFSQTSGTITGAGRFAGNIVSLRPGAASGSEPAGQYSGNPGENLPKGLPAVKLGGPGAAALAGPKP